MLVVGALFVSSVVMMLRRSHHSRLAYVVSCVAIGIAVPYVVAVSGGVAASVSTLSLTYDCLQTLAIALYLYLSKGSREYFGPPVGSGPARG